MLKYFFFRIIQKITQNEYSYQFANNTKVYLQNPPGSLKNILYKPSTIPDLNFFLKYIEPNQTFFDVGANHGYFSLMLHHKTKGKLNVHCFEPTDSAYRVLAMNNFLNGDKWNLNKLAIGEKREWIHMENNLGGYNHVASEKSETTKSALCITLDEYIESHDIQEIHLMKIDVEGFEPFVLNGAIESFKNKKIKKILLEKQGHSERYGSQKDGFSEFFLPLGYKLIDDVEGHECWSV